MDVAISGRPQYVNRRNMPVAVNQRREFQGSNISGSKYMPSDFGRLPTRYHNDLQLDSEEDDFYVIVSYDTPIAWCADGIWWVPNVNYSITTTKQLNCTGIPCRHGDTLPSDKWVTVEGK